MSTLDDATKKIDDAAAQLTNGLARLQTSDGKRVYADEMHAQQVELLVKTYDSVTRPVVERATREEHEAEERLQALSGDPAGSLSVDELTRATALATFVREDAERLPLGQVVAQMRAALASKSKVEAYLWQRYGRARAETERETGDAEAVGLVRRLAGDLAALVDPERDAKQTQLAHTIGAARSVRDLAERRRPTVDAAGNVVRQRYSFERDQDVPW